MENVARIPLTRGLVTIVDRPDLPLLIGYRWIALAGGGNTPRFYAAAYVDGKLVLMHRLLLRAPWHKHVDHVSGDALDNTRANIRIASASENQWNRAKNSVQCGKSPSSRFKGVFYAADRRKRWRAHIRQFGHTYHLGSFRTEAEAALVYNAAASQRFGEFARINRV